jgi:tRNA (guanine37-N1)-methyltransferase
MRVQVLTIFPELFAPFLATSLVGKAIEKGLLEVRVHDLREFTEDRHRSVDDEPYGGGGGMVMTAPPWIRAVRAVAGEAPEGRPAWRVLLSPQGRRLDDAKVRELAHRMTDGSDLVLLCGRYEGIDERVRLTVVDEEVSIGDYVLSGGELPAMVLIEALSRQVPGVVGLADSVANDSFRGGLLDHPHYTRPPVVEGLAVPEVLISGDHAKIRRWRQREALKATLEKRPDLLTAEQRREAERLREEE